MTSDTIKLSLHIGSLQPLHEQETQPFSLFAPVTCQLEAPHLRAEAWTTPEPQASRNCDPMVVGACVSATGMLIARARDQSSFALLIGVSVGIAIVLFAQAIMANGLTRRHTMSMVLCIWGLVALVYVVGWAPALVGEAKANQSVAGLQERAQPSYSRPPREAWRVGSILRVEPADRQTLPGPCRRHGLTARACPLPTALAAALPMQPHTSARLTRLSAPWLRQAKPTGVARRVLYERSARLALPFPLLAAPIPQEIVKSLRTDRARQLGHNPRHIVVGAAHKQRLTLGTAGRHWRALRAWVGAGQQVLALAKDRVGLDAQRGGVLQPGVDDLRGQVEVGRGHGLDAEGVLAQPIAILVWILEQLDLRALHAQAC